MQVRISRGKPPRWIWTEGLNALGQQEFAVPVPWPEDNARDKEVVWLLRFIEQYVERQQQRVIAGQTMEYGWSRLRFVAAEQGQRLLIEELRDDAAGEPVYVPGVARSVALRRVQDEVMRRNGVTGETEYPQRSKTAIVCNRVTPETIGWLRPLEAHRLRAPEGHFSGWFVGCAQHGHDHNDPEHLEQVHLLHLVESFPGLFPYLALPVQTALLFEATQVVVFRPGEQEGFVDPAPLLAALP
jgi:hypothetical protein